METHWEDLAFLDSRMMWDLTVLGTLVILCSLGVSSSFTCLVGVWRRGCHIIVEFEPHPPWGLRSEDWGKQTQPTWPTAATYSTFLVLPVCVSMEWRHWIGFRVCVCVCTVVSKSASQHFVCLSMTLLSVYINISPPPPSHVRPFTNYRPSSVLFRPASRQHDGAPSRPARAPDRKVLSGGENGLLLLLQNPPGLAPHPHLVTQVGVPPSSLSLVMRDKGCPASTHCSKNHVFLRWKRQYFSITFSTGFFMVRFKVMFSEH